MRFFEKENESWTNDSSDDESQPEDGVIEFDPNWNLIWPRFIVLSPVDESEHLTKLSPFAVEKHMYGKSGTVHKVTKMRSGSLLVEATRPKQARKILETTSWIGKRGLAYCQLGFIGK